MAKQRCFFIKIIKGKSKRRRVKNNILKRVWDFGMVWEAEIYSRTSGKDGRPALELLTGDMIDISEWLEFEFCELVLFWNKHSDYTKPMLGRWLGVSHRIGSAICYLILIEKGKVLSWTTVSTLLLKNQEILMFKSGSVIIMALCKMHLEARSLVLVWMDMNPSPMMMMRVLIRLTPTMRDIKDLQIPLR